MVFEYFDLIVGIYKQPKLEDNMKDLKILSVNTGRIINKTTKDTRITHAFTVEKFPFKLDFSIGATVMFMRDAPEFDLRFDIFSPSGNELDEVLHEFEPDYENVFVSDDGTIIFEVRLTPEQHIAYTPGVYIVRATLRSEDDDILDEMQTKFYLCKSLKEVI